MVHYLLLFLATSSICQASGFKVIIDPGHGGTDAGAVMDSTKESDITLDISKKLYQLLLKNLEFDVVLTRHKDEVVPLFERSKIAKKEKGNLFISIHANSSPDISAHGAEIYMQSQMPADEETLFLASRENDDTQNLENPKDIIKGDLASIIDDLKRTQNIYASQIFAETLINQWKKNFPLRAEPLKQGPFRVLVSVPMPSVLIEVGFLTHHKELARLKDSRRQSEIAEAIYNSIKIYKEKIDKSEFSSHIIRHANRL